MKTKTEAIAQDFDVLFADGFEEAILGVAQQACQVPVVAYSVKKCIQILESNGMTPEEAEDYFYYNVSGAYVGEKTPVFVEDRYD